MKKRSKEYLLDISRQITEVPAIEAGQLGYVANILVNASLPYRQLETNEFVRTNGNLTFTIIAPGEIGLPSGPFPRRLMIEIVTRAKIQKTREVYLGRSVTELMRNLGKKTSGGENGNLRTYKEQTKKLFSSIITSTREIDGDWSIKNMNIASEASVLWNPRNGPEWDSTITLGEGFYNDIRDNAVPIDMRVIHACSHYPLAMDIYCWLTYRYFRMYKPARITWKQLAEQFGCVLSRESNFRAKFEKAIVRVVLFYVQAKYKITKSGITLYPSPTHVPKKADVLHLNACG